MHGGDIGIAERHAGTRRTAEKVPWDETKQRVSQFIALFFKRLRLRVSMTRDKLQLFFFAYRPRCDLDALIQLMLVFVLLWFFIFCVEVIAWLAW